MIEQDERYYSLRGAAHKEKKKFLSPERRGHFIHHVTRVLEKESEPILRERGERNVRRDYAPRRVGKMGS